LFESAKEGVDTKQVWYRFTYWMLADADHGAYKSSKNSAIIAVAELLRKASAGAEVSQKEWEAAAAAGAYAYADAAYASAYAAGAATTYAAGAAAAYAASSAADAADAYAASSAADARIRHYPIMADKLCYFLAGDV
jgi:hypothetical protein